MKKKTFTQGDYIKAIKKADREAELEQSPGFRRQTNVHKNKKRYDRKRDKRVE